MQVPPRVLIVMDDQWHRALLRAALRDVGYDAMTLLVAGTPDKLDAISDLLAPFGIVESQRTGRIALPKLARQPTKLRAVKDRGA